jgi:hypothetical protein
MPDFEKTVTIQSSVEDKRKSRTEVWLGGALALNETIGSGFLAPFVKA